VVTRLTGLFDRYSSTNYVLLSVLHSYSGICGLRIIYNIACNFLVNFLRRILDLSFPHQLREFLPKDIKFFIDKFHKIGHGDKC
jgi:hypothetical protein